MDLGSSSKDSILLPFVLRWGCAQLIAFNANNQILRSAEWLVVEDPETSVRPISRRAIHPTPGTNNIKDDRLRLLSQCLSLYVRRRVSGCSQNQ